MTHDALGRTRRPLRRAAFAAALLVVSTVLPVTAASAATSPALADPTPVPTAQIDGVAYAQVVIGSTVYVGGRFRSARPAGAAPGHGTVQRSNLLAYDLTTGRLLPWAPKTNGVVTALARSSDGSTVYAAGGFTTVSGARRLRIAAISRSGVLRTGFHPALNSTVNAIAVHGSTVYAGGSFSSASGTARSRAAAFDGRTGAVRAWRPSVDGQVLALVVSSTGGSAVLGGRFAKVNGRKADGSARVGTGAGRTNLTWKLNGVVGNHGKDAAVYSLSSSGGYVYGTGYSYGSTVAHRLEGAFVASWRDGGLHWLEDCHGDSYAAVRSGDVVYVAGHAHTCATLGGFADTDPPVYHRALAFSQAATGRLRKNEVVPYSNFAGKPAPTLLDWYPSFNIGHATGQDQGPWDVITAGHWLLFAGEFTRVGGMSQQGLVRLRN